MYEIVTSSVARNPETALKVAELSAPRLFALVFAPLIALYLPTATTDLPYHIDAATNVITAWTLGTQGTAILEEHAVLARPEHRAVFGWVVESPRGPIAQYPPGTALLAAPLYGIFWPETTDVVLKASNATDDVRVRMRMPNLTPGALVGSVTAAIAMALLAVAVRELTGSNGVGVVTAAVIGLGTGAWSVAADALWQHGPNMMWISLGLYAATRERWALVGIAFAALAITRPPVLVVGAAIGLALLADRRWVEARQLLLGTAPGVAMLLAYNWWLYGTVTVSGGYGGVYAQRAAEVDVGGYIANVGDGLFGARIGLFVWSPFLALALVGATAATRRMPGWVVASALGGVAYLLVVFKLEPAAGGGGFSYYRYPLEAVAAAAPLLAASWQYLWSRGIVPRIGFVVTAGFSIVAHAIAAF